MERERDAVRSSWVLDLPERRPLSSRYKEGPTFNSLSRTLNEARV